MNLYFVLLPYLQVLTDNALLHNSITLRLLALKFLLSSYAVAQDHERQQKKAVGGNMMGGETNNTAGEKARFLGGEGVDKLFSVVERQSP